MHRNIILSQIFSAMLFMMLLSACTNNGNGGETPGKPQQVYEVTEIRLAMLKSMPPQLSIKAEGTTRTSGWTDAKLVPYQYVAPPADGIYEFDFKAKPPEDISLPAITPVSAGYIMNPLPETLKGVRIYAEQNKKVALLQQTPATEAFFEFRGTDEQDRFVIKLVERDKIDHARKLLAGETKERPSVMGIIVTSAVKYNPEWSYHLTPETISFFDMAVEVCDANMRYVEENLDKVGGAFLPGNRWCPWGSRLTRELTIK